MPNTYLSDVVGHRVTDKDETRLPLRKHLQVKGTGAYLLDDHFGGQTTVEIGQPQPGDIADSFISRTGAVVAADSDYLGSRIPVTPDGLPPQSTHLQDTIVAINRDIASRERAHAGTRATRSTDTLTTIVAADMATNIVYTGALPTAVDVSSLSVPDGSWFNVTQGGEGQLSLNENVTFTSPYGTTTSRALNSTVRYIQLGSGAWSLDGDLTPATMPRATYKVDGEDPLFDGGAFRLLLVDSVGTWPSSTTAFTVPEPGVYLITTSVKINDTDPIVQNPGQLTLTQSLGTDYTVDCRQTRVDGFGQGAVMSGHFLVRITDTANSLELTQAWGAMIGTGSNQTPEIVIQKMGEV